MYKKLIRPILFLFNPETAHKFTAAMLRFFGALPLGRRIIALFCKVEHPSLEREVLGIKFPNPIGVAAGLDKDATFYRELSALGFGFIEVGAVTPRPQPGNAKPRCFRLKKDRGLINRFGFNNLGMEKMAERLSAKRKKGIVVGVNLGKNSDTPNEQAASDYLKSFRALYDSADYFVVNVSCPNVENIGKLQNKDSISEILEPMFDFRRGQNNYRPILVKVSPDLSFEQLDEIVDVLIETPLDGLVATNTTTSRDNLKTSEKRIKRIGRGGLSGAPLHTRAVEVVRYLHKKTEGNYPIIGVGGIMSVEEAQEMLDAGANLIQLYTGFIYEGPSLVKNICKRLIK
ncbi:MAG: quinone-dependent dihydroorotate dehydrogenase [Rikenellaceae bacterium]|nr:quinone-dependent dihydroorotate dehydrogenase [Rikenellaceae bacterium]